jgi:hypothetical protein
MLVHSQTLFEVAFGERGLRLAGLAGPAPEVLQRAGEDPEGERLLGG